MFPTHERNSAECAAVIAAFADLEVPNVRPVAGVDAHAGVVRQRVAEKAAFRKLRNEAVGLCRAKEEIDLGERRPELFLVPLNEATNGDNGLACTVRLVTASLDDGVDRLLLRRVDEAARVDDDDVGFLERAGRLRAVRDQFGEVALAVDRVLVAAEGEKADLHGQFW
jgi:hypothetical protein